MNATGSDGHLKIISKRCFLQIGGFTYYFNTLPDLSDAKGATYNDESPIGRSVPIKTYSHSDNRVISCTITLVVQDKSDCKENLRILQYIRSCVYNRTGLGAPYYPPVICRLQCGSLFSEYPICCVMKDYSVKFPTDVPWDEETMCPYRMDISMTFDQVYSSNTLPNQDKILADMPAFSFPSG